MLPLGDENPTRLRPIVTWALIASCIAVFLWQSSSGASFFIYTLLQYGIIPVRVLGGRGLYSFITNIFLHGGWSHLLGNMLFLWVFGDNIEDHIACRSNSMFLGRLSYLGFYIVCGVTASAVWLVTAMDSAQPAVGASGAIAGVLGAYFVFYPKRRIRTLVGLGFFVRVIYVRAYTMIGVWFIYQVHDGPLAVGHRGRFLGPRRGFRHGGVDGHAYSASSSDGSDLLRAGPG